MITLKTEAEIAALREGGHHLSAILTELVDMVRPGMTTGELNAHATKRMAEVGGEPSFLGYQPSSDVTPYNSAVCLSIGSEVVHAPALPSRELKSGDVLKLDIGLKYKGLCTDMAVTVAVGEVTARERELIALTKEAMLAGIAKAVPGAWVSDVGKTVDKMVRRAGFTTVKDLTGHGVGHKIHEDPSVPNYFEPALPPVKIVPGMVLAIEPMVNIGREDVDILEDGWTFVTVDGSTSAQFEVTIAVTASGMEILTPVPKNA